MPGCGEDIGDSAGDGVAENGSKAFFSIVTHCCWPLFFQIDAETATGKDDRLLFTVNVDIKQAMSSGSESAACAGQATCQPAWSSAKLSGAKQRPILLSVPHGRWVIAAII